MSLTLTPTQILEELESKGNLGLLGKAPHWQRGYLGQHIKIQNGAPFASSKFNNDGVGTRLIRIRDVGQNDTSTFFNGEYDPAFMVKRGDILVGMDGDFRCARWMGPDALLNQRVCRLINNSDRLNDRFLYLILQGYLDAIWQKTSSTTVKHLSSKTIEQIPIPLPPIEVQVKIVEVLEEHLTHLEAALADVQRAKEKAAQFRSSMLHNALSGNSQVGSKNANLSSPLAWQKKKLEEVADWTSGGTPSSKDLNFYGGEIPWVVIGDLTESTVTSTEKTITEDGLRLSSAKLLPIGTVMVAMYGASIGRTGIMGREMATNQAIACAVPRRDQILEKYLLYFLQSQKVNFVSAGKGGAQPNISQAIIKGWEISLPNISEQQRIIEKIDESLMHYMKSLEIMDLAIKRIETLKRSLLQAAFTGKLSGELIGV
jgi:type I restriction enzyme S subunit